MTSTKDEIKAALKPGKVYDEGMRFKPGEFRRVNPPFNITDARNHIRILAQKLASEDRDPVGHMPSQASRLLMLAWLDCVNLEAEARMNAAGLSEVKFRARELAEKAHPHMDVCVPVSPSIGQPAMIWKVRDQPVVDAASNVGGAVPLWWHYVEQAQLSYADPIARVIGACRGDIDGLTFGMVSDNVCVRLLDKGFIVTKHELDDGLVGTVVPKRLKELREVVNDSSQRAVSGGVPDAGLGHDYYGGPTSDA